MFHYFDLNSNGIIEYDEFLRVIRGDMNPLRLAKVNQAFNKFDRDGSGKIDIDDLVGLYDGSKHPDVL